MASRAALLRYAAARPKDNSGALALVVAGAVKLEQKDAAQAAKDLAQAVPRLPLVADHVGYRLAAALMETQDAGGALRALAPVWSAQPASPLRGQAALVAAEAQLTLDQPAEAVRVLEANAEYLPQPKGLTLLGRALESRGDAASAATAFQRVYYEYPLASEATEAGAALDRLRAALGAKYPAETAEAMLGRVQKLTGGRDYRRARAEAEALIPKLRGAGRDLARVRLGGIDYLRRQTAAAFRYLQALELTEPEADAERLYYLVACARRLENDEAISRYQADLARRHAGSAWRLRALVQEANHHLLDNRPSSFVPLYRACYESFPDDPQAAYCHWKVVWREILERGPRAAAMLREHLTRYPGSEKASAALYFLGRLSEESAAPGAARSYYAEAGARFPNSFYGVLSRGRLRENSLSRAPVVQNVREFLSQVSFPERDTRPDFEADADSVKRVQRARLLASAALDDWASAELRFAAANGGQRYVMALELARIASSAGAPDRGLRHIKAVAPGYLYFPVEAAPAEFWKLAFPMPYRVEIEKYSGQRSLDPFLVAALIRQESEFTARAVSRARALGLMQVMPSTGRGLARKLRIPRFTSAALFRPDININLGTYLFRTHIGQYAGKLEPALAAYNAGKSRADAWLSWGQYREPAEFIETIPITETRDYVQIVLRNAEIYRRLYGKR